MNNAITGADTVFQNFLTYFLNPLFKGAIVIIFIYFLYGVLRYIFAMSNGATDDEINNGKRHLFWGLVGLFIIVSIGGIMNLLTTTIGGWFN